MGKPYKRKSDGRWAADYTDSAGQRKYVYGKTKRECQERLAHVLFRQAQGRSVTDSRQTLAAFLSAWLESEVKHNTRPNTYLAYRAAAQHAIRFLGATRLADLKPAQLQHAYAALLEEGRSPASVQIVHRTVRVALQRAVQWEMLSRNPAALARPPKRSRAPIRILSEAEAASLLLHTQDTPEHMLWHLLLTTGLRIGEALALTWADVDLDDRSVSVSKTLLRGSKDSAVVQDAPKTDRSNRLVHLTPSLTEELRTARAQRRAESDEWVFPARRGGPLSNSMAADYLRRATLDAGLPHVSPHDLRHTFATILLARNVHPKYVQEMLGHSSITQTLDTYSHLIPGMHRPVTDLFERIFDPLLSDSLSETPIEDAEWRPGG